MIWNKFKVWSHVLLCCKWDDCTILMVWNHRGMLFGFSWLWADDAHTVYRFMEVCVCVGGGCRTVHPSVHSRLLTIILIPLQISKYWPSISLYPPSSLCLHFSFMFPHHYSAVIVTDWVHCSKVSAVEKHGNHKLTDSTCTHTHICIGTDSCTHKVSWAIIHFHSSFPRVKWYVIFQCTAGKWQSLLMP